MAHLILCENKETDQLCIHRNQNLSFRYIDSTISLLLKPEISRLYSHRLWFYSPVCVGPGRKLQDRVSHYVAQIIKPLPVSVIAVGTNKKGADTNAWKKTITFSHLRTVNFTAVYIAVQLYSLGNRIATLLALH